MSAAQHQQVLSYTVDGVSGAAVVGALMGVLPPLVALLALVWYIIQIIESKTYRKYVRLNRAKRRYKRCLHRVATAVVGVVEASTELKAAVAATTLEPPHDPSGPVNCS